MGKKYYKAVKCEHEKIINEVGRMKGMRETTAKIGQNEKPSLLELLIQYGDINKEEIFGEIPTIVGAKTDSTSNACGYVLALLGENQHIQERIMQEQQDIFGVDILRPVRSDDLPRMVYLEQVDNCLLRSSLCSRIRAIFRHDIKRSTNRHTYITHTHTHIYIYIYSYTKNVQKYDFNHTLSLQQATDYSELFYSFWIFSIKNTVMEFIILRRTCGDSCQ